MDIGLLIPVAAPYATREFVHSLGTQAEAAGFSSLWVGEHVVVPAEWESQYPLGESGEMPSAVKFGELDSYTTLAYLAAITKTIRLGACTIVPQRNPVYAAKEIANADWLSGGRIDFGAGVGWSKEEFDAVSVSFAKRGSRCNSYLRVIKELWEKPVSEYHDEFYQLPASLLYPKPIQTPHPPIHVLGSSKASLNRVAELGNGFFPLDESPDELAALLESLDSCLQERGRCRDDIYVSVSPYTRDVDLDLVKQYRDAGADQVVLFQFLEDIDELDGAIDAFAQTIVEPARSL
ncbi:MAG: putative F420-dependent oxidoreductase [Alcanivorax sp.]|jgi:probable F420-dependent oxidoreductase